MSSGRESGGEALLRLLPPIRRARLWRLYAQNGKRFLDFWMDGGRDLLGAKGTGLGTAIKAAVDKGISRPLPSVWRQRIARQVAQLWPGFPEQRYFLNEERALSALAAALAPALTAAQAREQLSPDLGETRGSVEGLLHDPAIRGPSPAGAGSVALSPETRAALVLRPYGTFLDAGGALEAKTAVGLLRLPCSRMFAPAILVFRDRALAGLVDEDLLPPLMLAAASRSLWELQRSAPGYSEKLWARSDRRLAPYFERIGPFLYPRYEEALHETVFRAALAAGALISPRYSLPSLVPGDFDDGELALLAKALEAVPGMRSR